MKGLDISREFYLQYGKPMLEEQFPSIVDRIAVGLVGEGSECLGFDDEISRDHDFEPGFCLWLTENDKNEFGFQLARAYSRLPRSFMGLSRSLLSPVGGARRGVMSIDDFYTRFLGAPNAPCNISRWLYTPSAALCAASNGEVFSDRLGVFSGIRAELLKGYPEDIRRKKLAAHTVFMAQAGQYNYPRCMEREDSGTAQLAIFEFVKHAISAIYLLNNRYEPYYKWAYRGIEDIEAEKELISGLKLISELDNSAQSAERKNNIIEMTARRLIDSFREQGLSGIDGTDLEMHAYAIQNEIHDTELRNMHIMEGI